MQPVFWHGACMYGTWLLRRRGMSYILKSRSLCCVYLHKDRLYRSMYTQLTVSGDIDSICYGTALWAICARTDSNVYAVRVATRTCLIWYSSKFASILTWNLLQCYVFCLPGCLAPALYTLHCICVYYIYSANRIYPSALAPKTAFFCLQNLLDFIVFIPVYFGHYLFCGCYRAKPYIFAT